MASDDVPLGLLGGGAKGSEGFVPSEASDGLSGFTSDFESDVASARFGDALLDVLGDFDSPRAETVAVLAAMVR